MSQKLGITKPHLSEYEIVLSKEYELVPCGKEGRDSLNTKSLYIQSFRVGSYRSQYGLIERMALFIKKETETFSFETMGKTLKAFGANGVNEIDKLREQAKLDDEKDGTVDATQQSIDLCVETLRKVGFDTVCAKFKTFFSELGSSAIFVDNLREQPISIDYFFNEFEPEDIYEVCAAYCVLFLEPLLMPRKR
jgi:hypothetical protein